MIIWSPGITIDEMEKQIINKAYDFYNKNAKVTAESLNISVEYFHNKLAQYAKEALLLEENNKKKQKEFEDFNLRARGFAPSVDIELQTSVPEFKKSSFKKAELKLDA